jgi:hypothetical protein
MRRWLARAGLAAIVIAGAGCRTGRGEREPRAELASTIAPPTRWLKGQLHAHSSGSGDSATPAADVVRWYQEHGYDFVVLTDHNRVTRVDAAGPMLVFAGVELTQNLRSCTPEPEPGLYCLLHVNALFVAAGAPKRVEFAVTGPFERLAIFERALDRARSLGALAQINHPNFHYAADGPLLAELARHGAALVEIANEAVDSNNAGDARHPSSEQLWDAALTAGATLYGTATDDAHHYDDAAKVAARGEQVFTGDRGWVMVRAERDQRSIREALARGDFYASNGVALAVVAVRAGVLYVAVAESSAGDHELRFVGAGGRTLALAHGRVGEFPLAGAHGGYVRAVITDGRGRRAWTQPVRVP